MTQLWYCPKCNASAMTNDASQPMHPCRGIAGLMIPLLREGVRADLRPVEREDYVGKDLVQVDGNGRPVMAVRTIRDDGEDCTVFPATATIQEG